MKRVTSQFQGISPDFQEILDAAPVPTLVCAPDGTIHFANDAFCQTLPVPGQHPAGLRLTGLLPGLAEMLTAADGTIDAEELYLGTPGGVEFWGQVSAKPSGLFPPGAKWIVQITDITARKRAEDRLAYRESIWRYAVTASKHGVWDYNAATGERFYSDEWKAMRGIPLDTDNQEMHERWQGRVHPDDEANLYDAMEDHHSGEADTFSYEYRERHMDGHWIWISARGRALERGPDGRPLRVTGTDVDISHLKRMEEQRTREMEERHRAHLSAIETARREAENAHRAAAQTSRLDPLTELANRRAFSERMDLLTGSDRGSRTRFGLLLVDLDRFKPVNDTYGHSAGDGVIRTVASRLLDAASSADLVARLGGDEFGVLVIEDDVAPLAEKCASIARGINTLLDAPIEIGGPRVEIGCSIGIALFPDHGTDPSMLLRRADTALYHVKELKRGSFEVFDPEMDRALLAKAELEANIRAAVKAGEFEPHFQPVLELSTGRITAFESLARWQHPTRGSIPPAQFIPVVEQFGLQRKFGRAMLRRSLSIARAWPQDIRLAFNMTAAGFSNLRMPDRVFGLLEEFDFAPHRLEIEISEHALMRDFEVASEVTSRLRARGVRVVLDDFGVGYSGLNYLRWLKFDGIKLDRSFVMSMEEEDESLKIVRSVFTLARQFEMDITAEGVEDPETWKALRDIGYDFAQGFLFSKAVSGAETSTMLAQAPQWLPAP